MRHELYAANRAMECGRAAAPLLLRSRHEPAGFQRRDLILSEAAVEHLRSARCDAEFFLTFLVDVTALHDERREPARSTKWPPRPSFSALAPCGRSKQWPPRV